MTLMYLTYTWGNSTHAQSKKKNPADFENDKWTPATFKKATLCY